MPADDGNPTKYLIIVRDPRGSVTGQTTDAPKRGKPKRVDAPRPDGYFEKHHLNDAQRKAVEEGYDRLPGAACTVLHPCRRMLPGPAPCVPCVLVRSCIHGVVGLGQERRRKLPHDQRLC